MRTGFGLPPGIHDRRREFLAWAGLSVLAGAVVRADDFAVPHPRFRVDRFTHGTEHAQRGQVAGVRDVAAPLHRGANSGWGGIHDGDFVLLHKIPPAALVWGVHRAVVHEDRGAVDEWPVRDVGVAGDPADVRGAPVDVGLRVQVERVLRGHSGLSQVAAGRVQDALRLTRGSRRVEDEERMLGFESLSGVLI